MKNKKGFTLVELLAVIVILGILLLVAVPAVSTIIGRSKFNADKNEAIMFLKAIEACTVVESSGTSVCSSTDAMRYMDKTSSKMYAYTNNASASISSNGKIKPGEFVFMGSNGFIFWRGNAQTDSSKQNLSTKPVYSKNQNVDKVWNTSVYFQSWNCADPGSASCNSSSGYNTSFTQICQHFGILDPDINTLKANSAGIYYFG